MSPAFGSLVPMLQTGNMQRTIDWYCDILGFACVQRQGDFWCRLERDNIAFMFTKNEAFGSPSATATQYIYVDDVMHLYQAIREKVQTEWGPEVYSYGNLEFAIKDPDGYLLSFGQPIHSKK